MLSVTGAMAHAELRMLHNHMFITFSVLLLRGQESHAKISQSEKQVSSGL